MVCQNIFVLVPGHAHTRRILIRPSAVPCALFKNGLAMGGFNILFNAKTLVIFYNHITH